MSPPAPPPAAPGPGGSAGAGASAVDPGGGVRRDVLVVVFTTILIDFVGFSVLIPVLPIFAKRLGATPVEIGLLVTVYALAQLLFLPAWGWVSDRIGRRPVILTSLAGTTGAFAFLAVADDLTSVYVSRVLAGFFAASIGAAQAVITDVTAPEERARGMGVIGAAFGSAMVLGPVLGGGLAAVHERLPFYAIALLAAANCGLAWLRLPETAPREPGGARLSELLRCLIPTPIRLLAAVHERRIGLYLYLFFHLFTAFAVLEAMITFYLGNKFGASELDVALVFAWIGVVLAVTQGLLLRRLVAFAGEVRLIAAGLVAMAIGLAGVAWAPSFGWFFVLGPIIAFGNGITFPSFTSLYSKACAVGQAGELLAQSQSMATTGRIVGPLAAGLVMSTPTDGTPFVMAAGLMLLGLLIFAGFRRTLVQGLL